jgi:hypothetical protein
MAARPETYWPQPDGADGTPLALQDPEVAALVRQLAGGSRGPLRRFIQRTVRYCNGGKLESSVRQDIREGFDMVVTDAGDPVLAATWERNRKLFLEDKSED